MAPSGRCWRAHDRGSDRHRQLKKPLIWLVVAFFVYAIFKSPDQAAEHRALRLERHASTGCTAIGHFFDALLSSY